MSLIAANAGAATIITKTHITTTKIAVSAQHNTRPLRLASSDPKITKPDAISIDEFTSGIGADKRQVLNNNTASSIHLSNGTFTNGSVAGLGPGAMGLTASTTALNHTMLSKGNITASTQQSNTMSEKTDSSSGSENLNSMTARNSSQSILSTTRMANTTVLGTGATTPFSGTSNSSVVIPPARNARFQGPRSPVIPASAAHETWQRPILLTSPFPPPLHRLVVVKKQSRPLLRASLTSSAHSAPRCLSARCPNPKPRTVETSLPRPSLATRVAKAR